MDVLLLIAQRPSQVTSLSFFARRLGGVVNYLATSFIPPAHTSDHIKVMNKVEEGRQVYASRSLDHFNFRYKFFLFQNY